MSFDRIGVAGAGLMGSGIAQAAAVADFATVVRDVSEAALRRGEAAVRSSLDRLVDKGKLDAAARQTALTRLTWTTDFAALGGCELVIEAVPEDAALKRALWHELDNRCPAATIFASNTSSLSITELAAATGRPDRFIGLHFFNPVPLMPLVEVVRGLTTSAETFDAAMAFVRRLGKEPIVARDRSGFIVNRLLVPYLLDAVRALEEGTGSVADIDRGMQLGCGHPMGPFTLLDLVGLDTTLSIGEILFREFGDARFAPPGLLRRMVAAGLHGRKSGRGFYDYTAQPPTPIDHLNR
ncbi:MAG TPA: 3-hydroxybutyryl-CoA dehydrogenase [Gemmatimonadales bacterium]|nr:3-hydroxybutyryl-CoA dehydrogenase [Gemmatimonadales bacterium]